jgi:hypothetical protein
VGLRIDPDPVPVLFPEPVRSELLRTHAQDGFVSAVRLARQRTGLDLLSAVRAVTALTGDDRGREGRP